VRARRRRAPYPAPAGADIYVVHKAGSGSGWAVTDCHAETNAKPIPDNSQDAALVSMEFDAATRCGAARGP
jgi:hypothetical protein